jgi:hypothetical protein
MGLFRKKKTPIEKMKKEANKKLQKAFKKSNKKNKDKGHGFG